MLMVARKNGEEIIFTSGTKEVSLTVKYEQQGMVSLLFRGKANARKDGEWTIIDVGGTDVRMKIAKFCLSRVKLGILAPQPVKVSICNGKPSESGNAGIPSASNERGRKFGRSNETGSKRRFAAGSNESDAHGFGGRLGNGGNQSPGQVPGFLSHPQGCGRECNVG